MLQAFFIKRSKKISLKPSIIAAQVAIYNLMTLFFHSYGKWVWEWKYLKMRMNYIGGLTSREMNKRQSILLPLWRPFSMLNDLKVADNNLFLWSDFELKGCCQQSTFVKPIQSCCHQCCFVYCCLLTRLHGEVCNECSFTESSLASYSSTGQLLVAYILWCTQCKYTSKPWNWLSTLSTI